VGPEDYVSYQDNYSRIDATMLDGDGGIVMDRNRGTRIGIVKRSFTRVEMYLRYCAFAGKPFGQQPIT